MDNGSLPRQAREPEKDDMGIFAKKECSICGDKSGLLSNKKLADGNLCKNCRAKLSPFYDLSSRDTAADIAAQLEYRERNLIELERFHPTVTAGGAGKVFIDMNSGKFTLASERELREGNPDLFDLRGLHSCSFYARERIIKGDEDESDRFEYDFYLKLTVDHPFLRGLAYRYNDEPVANRRNRIREEEIRKIYLGQKDIKSGLSALLSGVDRKATEQYLEQYAIGQEMIEALTGAAEAFRATPRQPARSAAAEVRFCSNCGARVDGGAFCTQCGSRL
jgi:hypothetical protein